MKSGKKGQEITSIIPCFQSSSDKIFQFKTESINDYMHLNILIMKKFILFKIVLVVLEKSNLVNGEIMCLLNLALEAFEEHLLTYF